MSRVDSFHRVATALETGDWDLVSEGDLAVVDLNEANAKYRQWIAGGRVTLPLHDPDEGDDAVDEVLLRVGSRAQSPDGRVRLTLEACQPIRLFAGDEIFIRRATPLRDPERGGR